MHCPLEKFPGVSDLYDLVCTGLLRPGETIIGTPVVDYQPHGLTGPDALSLGAPAINAAPVDYPDGVTAQAGQAIQVRIQGGIDDSGLPRDYLIIATFETTLGNTKIATGVLRVVPLA